MKTLFSSPPFANARVKKHNKSKKRKPAKRQSLENFRRFFYAPAKNFWQEDGELSILDFNKLRRFVNPDSEIN
jgi:hypothetical protein